MKFAVCVFAVLIVVLLVETVVAHARAQRRETKC